MQFCRMFKRMKEKWNVSWMRFILIFTTFALGGSLCGYLGKKLLGYADIDSRILFVIAYIMVVTLLWPMCVLLISIPLGQFNFFRNYLAKMGRRMAGKKAISSQQLTISNIPPTKHIAIFASGAGSNARKIIEYFKNSATVKVALIVCNNPRAAVLYIAAEHSIPTLMVNKQSLYKEDNCLEELRLHQIDLIVLAGFLWMIPQNLINNYRNRIINIHPALLPKFGGKGMYGENVHKTVIEAGEKESGITIHYVDEHYDNGDVIFQARCIVDPDDTPSTLAEKVHKLEHEHYSKVIEKLIWTKT